ncbi:hypothetical protein [Arthrobacter sp. ISL-65]|uniref:hypothetical protein n=1 Tax=Arthrobacter sp. ISL-65 TaxID=2819112 RepID=UPI001BE6C261|nr:hypothetical protein [Arthrobacter sp. ISL-65]MBT2550533.1 hypothetical protein [Arthrobacter sp. ISL-65]
MKPTTSVDLTAMAAQVPGLVAAHSLRLINAHYANIPDVLLDEGVGIEGAVEVAALTGAPFISLEREEFDAEALLDGEELPDDLIKRARKYQGQLECLNLQWAAQGLTYEWSVGADWREKLSADIARAELETKLASATRAQVETSATDEIIASLVDSPDFRQATQRQRSSVGFAILANRGETDYEAVRQAVNRACHKVDSHVLQTELLLKPKLEELGGELRKTPAWLAATSDIKRHNAAIEYLIEKSGGYRLSPRISDPLMRAARELEEKSAIKIPFPK